MSRWFPPQTRRRLSKSIRLRRTVHSPVLDHLEERSLLSVSPLPNAQIDSNYGKIPLSFEANVGQAGSAVDFISRGSGYALFLNPTSAVLSLGLPQDVEGGAKPASVVTMRLVGADPLARVRGEHVLPGTSNYLLGNDPSHWHTNVPNYGEVRYENIYSGIDLTYHGNQRELEYDYEVAPGADPSAITMEFQDAGDLAIDPRGDLVISTVDGSVIEHAPVIYQVSDGQRHAVQGRFVLESANRVGFAIGAYDQTLPLVIDPVLTYATYLGGTGDDRGLRIAVDAKGNAYVAGTTKSTNFPRSMNPFQMANAGDFDVFVSKLDPTGSTLLYSTYLGGNGGDVPAGLAIDTQGNVYLAGDTGSTNFPTFNPIQAALSGSLDDAFITKLNPGGTALVFSTYLGGINSDRANGLALDDSNNVYVAGVTDSVDFPTKAAFQVSSGGSSDAWVAAIQADGKATIYSSYLGGTGSDAANSIAADHKGNVFIAGSTGGGNFPVLNALQPTYGGGAADAFVAAISAAGTRSYVTFLGGMGLDQGLAIALDSANDVAVTGATSSTDFPKLNALQAANGGGSSDAFVSLVNSAGSALSFSTYLGAAGPELGTAIAVDSNNNIVVAGSGADATFPAVNPLANPVGNNGANFVAKYTPGGASVAYATRLGGTGAQQFTGGVAVDTAGSVYLIGSTSSTDFPTTSGVVQPNSAGGGFDAFIAKITEPPPPPVNHPPMLTAIPAQNAVEGTQLSLTASATDQDVGQMLTFSLDPGFPTGASINPSSGVFTWTPTNGPSQPSVTVRVTDNGSPPLSDAKTFTITVANVAPSVSVGSNTTLIQGTMFARSGSFTDPGTTDSWTATVDYGDGSGSQALNLNSDKTFNLSHVYKKPGSFTVAVQVKDSANAVGNGGVTVKVLPTRPGDFDADGKTDTAIYDQTDSKFFVLLSGGGALTPQFGNPAHKNIPVPGDFDGDGKTDTAIYDQTDSKFFVLLSGGGALTPQFGNPAHKNIPVPGDFDADGKTDTAIYDQTDSKFFVLLSGGGALTPQFGNPAHKNVPIAGDFDADNKTDTAIYDQTDSKFFVLLSGGGALTPQFGNPAHKNIPVPGDFDGDGKTDTAIYDQTDSKFFVLLSGGGALTPQFGNPAHKNVPVYGDYDGDNKTDTAIYDQTDSKFFVLESGGGALTPQFGNPAHRNVPIPAAYIEPTLFNFSISGAAGGALGGRSLLNVVIPNEAPADGFAIRDLALQALGHARGSRRAGGRRG